METARVGQRYTVPEAYGASPADAAGRPLSGKITGGPVWGGFAIGFAAWVLLEVFLVSVQLVGMNIGPSQDPDMGGWWWSLGAAVIALFLGGLVAGIASRWNDAPTGILLGITVWSVVVLAVLLLSALGAGIGFGAFGPLLATGRATAQGINITPGAVETARDAAAVTAVVLAVTAIAAALGGAVGAKLWPRGRRTTPTGSEAD